MAGETSKVTTAIAHFKDALPALSSCIDRHRIAIEEGAPVGEQLELFTADMWGVFLTTLDSDMLETVSDALTCPNCDEDTLIHVSNNVWACTGRTGCGHTEAR